MASTYVNNLRLNEMATGDASGTWGTVTNLNLELIGQALGYGTRAIANASTDNITIADGASDADRSMYLKLTGGGQACTVTILPNTVSKVWWMENATSYTLTFTCGSGANVAILAGETKCIATDGAGSGGVVYDVLTDVNLAGTTKTAALTNAGALSNQGTVTVGVDDTGYDVKFFGATSGSYMLWDESADDLILGGAAGLTVAGVLTGASLDISGDIDVDGTTNLDVVDIDGAVDMASTLTVTGVLTANAGVVVDNFTLDGTTLALSSGDMLVDVAGNITFDADDAGEIRLKDGGTQYGALKIDSSRFKIQSTISDADMLFAGNDGGSEITALTLDMSTGGTAYFADDVRLTDNHAIRLGTDGNIVFFHDNSNGYLENGTGNLTLDSAGDVILDADSDLIKVFASGTQFGTFYSTGNDFLMYSAGQDKDIIFQGNDGGSTVTALTLDMSAAGEATFNKGATFGGTVTQSTAKTAQFTGQYDGRETTAITLGSLGFKPQVLFCIFNVGTSQHASWGMAARDGGHQSIIDYDPQAANDGYESGVAYFGRLAFGSAIFSNLAVSSWNADNVVIQKSVDNVGNAATCKYKIIVMG